MIAHALFSDTATGLAGEKAKSAGQVRDYYRTMDTFMPVQSLIAQIAVLQKKKSSEMDVAKAAHAGPLLA
jgi:hypothetical protein